MFKNLCHALTVLAVTAAVALAAGPAHAQVDLGVFVKTGDPAPGTEPGTVFRTFARAAINASGQVAFLGFLPGPGNDSGIWGSDAAGDLSLVARLAAQAPGLPEDVRFARFASPSGVADILLINAAGEIVFFAGLFGPGIDNLNDDGIWGRDASGALRLLVREGDQAPGTPAGTIFAGLLDFVVNAQGELAVRATLRGPGVNNLNNIGIWRRDSSGTLSLLARTGDPAPGTNVVFGPVDNGLAVRTFSKPVIGRAGEVAFTGSLAGPGLDFRNDQGIWRSDATGNVTLLVRGGDRAPGTAAAVVFQSGFGDPAINAAGDTAFVGRLTGPGVFFPRTTSIWGSDASGLLNLLLRGGDQAPGAPTGVAFSSFANPVINTSGNLAFLGLLTGPTVNDLNDIGILGPDASGDLTLLAREGDQALGTPTGTLFGFRFGNPFGNPAINAADEVAFLSGLTGPDVTPANELGVWGPDGAGDLGLLARTGDTIELSPGDSARIRSLGVGGRSGNEDGRSSGLSDDGQTVLVAGFDDQRAAILVSKPNAPPEIVASLTPAGEGDEDGDDDEGLFRVTFSATDTNDPAPEVTAVLVVPGHADIPVVNGQVIEYEVEDEDTEVESEDGILEIEAPSLTLRVTATDSSGLSATVEVQPAGLGADNDDDSSADADDDD